MHTLHPQLPLPPLPPLLLLLLQDPQTGISFGLTLAKLHTCLPSEAEHASLLLSEDAGVLAHSSAAARGSIQKQLAVQGLAVYFRPGSAGRAAETLAPGSPHAEHHGHAQQQQQHHHHHQEEEQQHEPPWEQQEQQHEPAWERQQPEQQQQQQQGEEVLWGTEDGVAVRQALWSNGCTEGDNQEPWHHHHHHRRQPLPEEGRHDRDGHHPQQEAPLPFILLPTDCVLHLTSQMGPSAGSDPGGMRIHAATVVHSLDLRLAKEQVVDLFRLLDRLQWLSTRNRCAAYRPAGLRPCGAPAVPWRSVWQFAVNAVLDERRGPLRRGVRWHDADTLTAMRQAYVALYQRKMQAARLPAAHSKLVSVQGTPACGEGWEDRT